MQIQLVMTPDLTEAPAYNAKTVTRLQILRALVDELADTTSNLAKRRILVAALTGPRWRFIERVLRIVNDPFRKHWLRSESVKKPDGAILWTGVQFLEALDMFARREVTGNEQRAMWLCCRNELPPEFTPLLDKILDQDLGVRCGIAEVNKAFEEVGLDLIPEFDVALGTPYEKNEKTGKLPDLFSDGAKWAMSRKYDGLRCLFILNGNDVRLLTRSGNEFHTLDNLKHHAQFYDGPPVVLDGEVSLFTKDGSDDFKGILKEWGRKDHTIKNPRFHCFDAIPYDEFVSGQGTTAFSARQREITRILKQIDPKGTCFTQVEQEPCESAEELEHAQQRAAVAGWEGLILRRRRPYIGRRSRDVYKVKAFFQDDFRVIDHITGLVHCIEGGREVKRRGLVAVVFKYKGNNVKCGSGFDLAERMEYFAHPDRIVGHVISVRHFGESRDEFGNPSLRFPTLAGLHGKERLV